METRVCSKCNEELPIDMFYRKNTGRRFQCKNCSNKYNREYYIRKNCYQPPKIIPPDGYRICGKCHECLAVSEFYKSKIRKDGIETKCKKCRSQEMKKVTERNYKEWSEKLIDDRPANKICPKCKLNLPISEFYKDPRKKLGVKVYCKECLKVYVDKNVKRDTMLQRTHGITQNQFDSIAILQNHKCAICNTDNPLGNGNVLHVDHDHDTGKIRGLLCTRCNMVLGLMHDNPDSLIKAAKYIENQGVLDDSFNYIPIATEYPAN